jgi:hypothetical protein
MRQFLMRGSGTARSHVLICAANHRLSCPVRMGRGVALGPCVVGTTLSRRWRHTQAGFSLIEAIVAAGLLAGGMAALGQLFAISIADTVSARTGTYVSVLAEQKVEQLRGLMWGFDASGSPVSDLATNTALPHASPVGGTGLTASPPGSLTANTSGYVDYLDMEGRIVGGGATPPEGTAYIRRWSIEPLPSNQAHALLIHVVVTARFDRGPADASGSTRRLRDEARLMTIRTRKPL